MQGLESHSNPPLTDRPSGAGPALKTRAAVAMGGLAVAFLLLIVQLARIQIVDADFYRHQAERQQVVRRQLSARRGRIFDRNGRLLASSVQRWSIYADPKGLKRPEAAAVVLSHILNVSRERLLRDFRKDTYFVWVKRQVSDQEAARVRELGLAGVHLQRESKRLYPQGALAAHVIGFTDIDGRGLAGIEMKMDALLRGRRGMEAVLCDGGRRIFGAPPDAVSEQPFNGYDVYLTLDAYIQNIVEQELAKAVQKHEPESATAVVLDVRDGSILSMASWPSFDPQAPAATPVGNQRNLAISDAYEFGSVLKPIAIAAALECGIVEPDTQFDCHNGQWRVGGRTLHDAHPYGLLTVSDIICHSSNIGAAQVGLRLGAELLHSAFYGFGFGRPGNVALPGEAGGIVRPLKAWNDYSVVSVSFGQELTATPLAVARAFAVFANGGRLLQPRIVKAVKPTDGGKAVYTAGPPLVSGSPISPRTAAQVFAMLARVVREGTGRNARLSDYPVAGKTGTAQMLRPDGRGYSDKRYLSSFCGIAPVGDPRIVVLVSLKAPTKNGYYGGTAAAPAARRIIERTLRYLKVPPAAAATLALGETP